MAKKTTLTSLTATQRTYIYRIVGSAVPLLVTLGVVSDTVAGQIIAIAAAVLSIGGSALALANVTPDAPASN
jgi:hypothetical protein